MRDDLGRFVKGHKKPKSMLKKIALKQIGKKRGPRSESFKKKLSILLKGRKHSFETIQKIKKARAKQIISHSIETKNKIGLAHKGKKHSEQAKIKIGLASLGRKYSKEINRKKGHKKELNPNWKGGKYKTSGGYIMINMDGEYFPEHRIVMEKHIGRKLEINEVVHHINKIQNDNRIENLILFKNQSDHIKHHASLKT